jgi:hypothetical protein
MMMTTMMTMRGVRYFQLVASALLCGGGAFRSPETNGFLEALQPAPDRAW